MRPWRLAGEGWGPPGLVPSARPTRKRRPDGAPYKAGRSKDWVKIRTARSAHSGQAVGKMERLTTWAVRSAGRRSGLDALVHQDEMRCVLRRLK
jgi:hypothetical protein